MKFKRIKKRFLEKKLKALLQEPASNKEPVHKNITTVGILSLEDVSLRTDLRQLISDTLNVRNAKIYSFRTFSKDNEPSYKHFSENDFDWKGNITDTSLKAFLDEEFDLLITFFDEKQLYMEYVTLLSKATFKVGYGGVNEHLFDMEVQTESSDLSSYLGETRKYLQILGRLEANS